MQLRTRPLVAVLCLAAMLTACKSTEGHDRAASTADQVVAVGSVAGQTQASLDDTLNSMEQVVATMKQGPKAAFDGFSKHLASFSSNVAKLTSERTALSAKAETWFTEFEKQNVAIQDPDLRKTGEKRLADFREQVADVSKQVDVLMRETTALEGRIKDLRAYLGNDLTPDGIEAVSGRISDAAKDGRKVAVGLGELSKSSDALAAKMRASRPPPPPK